MSNDNRDHYIGDLPLNSNVAIGNKAYTIYGRTPGLVRLRNDSNETLNTHSNICVTDDTLHNHRLTWRLG